MARSPKAVEVQLENIYEFGTWPNGNPYLWTVFFKIDGSTLTVTNAGELSGNCVIFPSMGSHGDLGSAPPSVGSATVPYYYLGDSGDATDTIDVLTWAVPDSLGLWISTIVPIAIPPALQTTPGVTDAAGGFGLVAVLMNNANSLPNRALEVGHALLNSEVESLINGLLRTINPGHQSITAADIEAAVASADISKKISDAVKGALSIGEELTAWNDGPDTEILQQVWNWDQDVASPTDFVVSSGQNAWGDWADWQPSGGDITDDFALTGSVYVSDQCPANAFADIFSQLFGAFGGAKHGGASRISSPAITKWQGAMRSFRDDGMLEKYQGLSRWWRLLAEHSPHLTGMAIRNKELREPLYRMVEELPSLLKEPNKRLPKSFLKDAEPVLRALSRSRHLDLRVAAVTAYSLLPTMSALSVDECLKLLGMVSCSRIPRDWPSK